VIVRLGILTVQMCQVLAQAGICLELIVRNTSSPAMFMAASANYEAVGRNIPPDGFALGCPDGAIVR
jgi:hypothetical protein